VSSPPPLVIITHVAWEGPGRIAACARHAGLAVDHRSPIEGHTLPPANEVAGALIMGGPMNVDQTDRYPALAAERDWVERALGDGLPMLGVCLGAQLIARALGATVRAGRAPEIGWAAIEVLDPSDPVVGPLAPRQEVLHWHGEVFDTPPGARALARSQATDCQAFRHDDAWGVLFHAEADTELVDDWLAEPSMADEARSVLGADAPWLLREGARLHAPELVRRSTAGFAHFAARVRKRSAGVP
jgi:GMP synthase (glutamine-hydrolysing)